MKLFKEVSGRPTGLEAEVRRNTVLTLASLDLPQLVDVTERYKDQPYMLELVGQAAIVGLVETNQVLFEEQVRTRSGQGRNFGLRLNIVAQTTTLEYILDFAEGRSSYLPPQF